MRHEATYKQINAKQIQMDVQFIDNNGTRQFHFQGVAACADPIKAQEGVKCLQDRPSDELYMLLRGFLKCGWMEVPCGA